MRVTNEQKRLLEEVNTKLAKALERQGFTASYHPQMGNGLVLHSITHRITQVLKGPMMCVEGVELFLETYARGRRDATRDVTAANEAAMRKLMGIKVNRDGTMFVDVDDSMELHDQD